MSDEPSEEDVRRYAAFLHMKLPEDEDLLWIPREGLCAPLPAPWTACRTSEEELFYYNFDTGESSWEHPCDDYYRKQYLAQKTRKQAENCLADSNQSIRKQLETEEAAERAELLRLHQEALQCLAEQSSEVAAPSKAELALQAQTQSAEVLSAKRTQVARLREAVEQKRAKVTALRNSALRQRASDQQVLADERLQAEAALAEELAQRRSALSQRLEQQHRLAEVVFQRTTSLQQASLTHSRAALRWTETRVQADVQERLTQAQVKVQADFEAEQRAIEREFQTNLQHLSVVPMQTLLQRDLAQYRSQVQQTTAQRRQLLETEMQAKLHAYEHHLSQRRERSSTPITPESKTRALQQALGEVKKEVEFADQELLHALRELVEARQHTPDSLEAVRKLKELIMNPSLQA